MGDMTSDMNRRKRDDYGVLIGGHGYGPTRVTTQGLPAGYRITSDEFGLALIYRGKIIRTSADRDALVAFAAEHRGE